MGRHYEFSVFAHAVKAGFINIPTKNDLILDKLTHNTLLLLFVYHTQSDRFFFGKTKPVSIYLFIVNNGNTRNMCEICSELTIKTP